MTDKSFSESDPAAQRLLDVFTQPDLEVWRQEAERLLRGAPFAKKMFTRTIEGITVGPLYTAIDTDGLPWLDTEPGQAPFVRGTRTGGYRAAPWLVAQELVYPTVEELNNALRHDLKKGQTAVSLRLDGAGMRGLDPDQAPAALVGREGTSLASLADLSVALDGVDLAETPIFVQAGTAAFPVLSMLLAEVKRRGLDPRILRGCVGCDPVFGLARDGRLPLAVDRLYDELAATTVWAAKTAPGLRTLPAWEAPWHDGGADSVLGLGLTLAVAVEHLRQLEKRDVPVDLAQAHVQFNLSCGPDFFMELAKLRALRLLWHRVTTACGCDDDAGQAWIHVSTSGRNQTVHDPYVNMLRATTSAMSAVLGGTDSLYVLPFDAVDSLPGEFSRRIARNVQLILAQECHFDAVSDPAGGSWYVEKLTVELAKGAWEVLQAIDAAGGIIEALKLGVVQDKVAEVATQRTERLATGRDVLVGTNRYPAADEPDRQCRTIDHEDLARRRSEAVRKLRTDTDNAAHQRVLVELEKILTADREHWLETMTEAVGQGATLGEVVAILRHDTDSDLDIQPVPERRDAEPFERLRAQVAARAAAEPADGRVFCACLGNVARYMPRLDFVRGFFQAGGFEVRSEAWFEDAPSAVAAAADDGARFVVLVGLDDTYAELGEATARGLSQMPTPPKILLAGQPDQREALEQAGVGHFIHLRSHLLSVLSELVLDRPAGDPEVRS